MYLFDVGRNLPFTVNPLDSGSGRTRILTTRLFLSHHFLASLIAVPERRFKARLITRDARLFLTACQQE